ncbi:MAG: hypothetical protein FRX49_00394 [Trebouxia sp. A1-2]|nr:MAG: hypothetical protein FRX49_00394 [Trebouxia sp. A1-2]
MEEEEMTFDAMPAVHLELVRKKLSRLKRAHVPSEAVTAAQPHSPAVAAFDAAPRALSDRTNLESCPEPASHLSPLMPPTTTAHEPSASPPNSPAQTLLGSENSPKVSEKSAAQIDYWDSEDELEAELTRRERAEGFHAESATSSEGKAPTDGGDNDSDVGSPGKSCSPDNYEELNSQTQRVLRDSAKRDVIGQGHAIQWQPLSSVLGKILTRKDAVIMRAPVVPVRPAKPVRQAPASPPGLQSRLHSQAGKLIGHPEEAQDQDLLVLSDDDSEQGGPQRDAVLADATLSLKQAQDFVAQHKTKPPHQNRLGLPVGSAVNAPQDDTQEMGFDSIPFEEPELFRVRSGLPALPGLADKEQSRLHLRLDSQDMLDGSSQQDDEMIGGVSAQAGDGSVHASQAADSAAQSDDNECEADQDDKAGNEDDEHDDDDSLSGSGHNSSGAEDSPLVGEGSDLKDVSPSPNKSKDEESLAADEEDEEADAASQSGAESMSEDGSADSQPEPGGTSPAEMSEDEGHSQGDADSDADDDGDLEDLIGQEKDRAGDESRRAKVHQQWLEQQDAQQVAHLMAGLRNGFRRKRAGDLLDEDVGTDYDTRKRRACRDGDEESLLSEDEEDRLAGLLRGDGDDSDDAGLDEHEKEQLRRAHVLKGVDVKEVGSIDLDAGSQEILALLSSASQGNGEGHHSSRPPATLLQLPSKHQPPLVKKTTFMGRSVPSLTAPRGASQMASRSYVFGKDDSNSGAPITAGPDNTALVTGPTSFSGLESMLGDSAGRAGSSSATQHESKEAFRKPSLLGRLAGSSTKLGPVAGSMSASDLQNALASSFGARAAAKANNALKRR